MIKLLVILCMAGVLLSVSYSCQEKGKVYVVKCNTTSTPVYSIGPPTQELIDRECKGER